jgi:phospholysine phosphohistidine inorganic pyrophosphate phosphatase
VVGDYRDGFTFDNLNHALQLLSKGVKMIGMQAELTDSSSGDLELNVGAWASMLERATEAQAIYIGKPNPFPFELAMDRLKLPKDQVLAVGDRVSTDIAGARGFDIRSALVRTGEFKPGDLEGSVKPDYIFDEVKDILVLFG